MEASANSQKQRLLVPVQPEVMLFCCGERLRSSFPGQARLWIEGARSDWTVGGRSFFVGKGVAAGHQWGWDLEG